MTIKTMDDLNAAMEYFNELQAEYKTIDPNDKQALEESQHAMDECQAAMNEFMKSKK